MQRRVHAVLVLYLIAWSLLTAESSVLAAPIDYTDAVGSHNWSNPAGWDQNSSYPGLNDPSDTATIDNSTTTVDVDVPLMGAITVNGPGQLAASRTLGASGATNNTVTVNSSGQVTFSASSGSQKYYWNMILNNGSLFYGNLHKDSGMYGTFTIGENATVTIRHNGGTYNSGRLFGAITAPRSATIDLESVSYTEVMQMSSDNSNLLADVNIKCPIDLYYVNALGLNSTGGTIKVLPNGRIGAYRWDEPAYCPSLTFTRDFTFVGGGAGGKTHFKNTIKYAGQFNLQADAAFVTSTASFQDGRMEVSGKIAQDATPRRFSFSTTGSNAASGKLYLSNAANNFSGGLDIATGMLYVTVPGAQGLGPISLISNGKLFFDAVTDASWTINNSIGGVGVIQVETGTTSYTLTAAGGTIAPGVSSTAAGTLQVKGNLAFAQNAGTPATLAINLVGSGSPVVVTNDVLAVTGNVTGISNARVSVSLSGITSESDVDGRTFTILTSGNDLTGQQFANVTCQAPFSAKVTCGNGQAIMVVGSRPTMQVVPSVVQFRAKPAETPVAQAVQVGNIGFGNLNWTAAVRAPAPSWLSLTNATGGNDASFALNVNRSGLAVGTYMAYIDVTDPNATNTQSVMVVLQALPETVIATHSFTNSATRGTHPSTVTASNASVTANLSALPTGTQVYRAILVPNGVGCYAASQEGTNRSTLPLKVESLDAPGVWLDTVAPRYKTLDCTAAVQRAMLASDKTLRIRIVSPLSGQLIGSPVRVDVWCDQPISTNIQQVTSLQAMHRSGDTMLTYREVEQPFTSSTITGQQYTDASNAINATNEIRYRIYRSDQPIDAYTIRSAELVDEIGVLSGWNTEYSQDSWSGRILPMYPIDDMTLAPFGTGIYVHRAKSAGNGYYAVSRSVDGEEDLSTWIPGFNTTDAATAETPGTGMVLQWKVAGPETFDYVSNVMKYYFVKWETSPDTWSAPNKPHNYLVAVPPGPVGARPVTIGLHCYGGTMETGYGAWRESGNGSLLVATHDIPISPYDWWIGYHENTGTIRPWLDSVEGNGGGKVRNYTQNRVWSFVENFVNGHWTVDMNRVTVQGDSMGGSGASMWGIRNNDKFSTIYSRVGVHIPAESLSFTASYVNVFGPIAWNCLYNDTGMAAFTYWDSEKYLRDNVAADTPFIIFANGKNDYGIGWNQAWKYAKAMQETRRPHMWSWGQNDHNQGLIVPGTGEPNLSRDKTVPAFTCCSLDENPGNGDPANGDATGALNRYLWFEQDGSVDTASSWEMTCLLIGSAPQSTCTVDITPRRCQAFKPAAGTVCTWTNTDLGSNTVVASGTAAVDANGLVTLPQVTVGKTKNRISITVPSALAGDVNGDGHVDVVDLLYFVVSFGLIPGDDGFDPRCDFNHDDSVDVIDLLMLVENFGL